VSAQKSNDLQTLQRQAQQLDKSGKIGDFVPGYEAGAVGGLGAPKGTPMQVIEALNAQINAALIDPTMK
jgi:hypothetical protein